MFSELKAINYVGIVPLNSFTCRVMRFSYTTDEHLKPFNLVSLNLLRIFYLRLLFKSRTSFIWIITGFDLKYCPVNRAIAREAESQIIG